MIPQTTTKTIKPEIVHISGASPTPLPPAAPEPQDPPAAPVGDPVQPPITEPPQLPQPMRDAA